jgi:PAS domain S-box-containing protein
MGKAAQRRSNMQHDRSQPEQIIDLPEADAVQQFQSEPTFQALLHAAPDAIVIVDQTGQIVVANQKVEVLFGYQQDDLIGQPVELLLPSRFQIQHQEHRSGYSVDPHARPMGAGMDLAARRKDGSEFPVEVSLSPLQTADGLLITSVIRDISRRKQFEEELRASQARLAGVVDIAEDAIISLNETQQIQLFNQGAEKVFGYTAGEVLGQQIDMLLPERFRQVHRQHVRSAQKRRGVSCRCLDLAAERGA